MRLHLYHRAEQRTQLDNINYQYGTMQSGFLWESDFNNNVPKTPHLIFSLYLTTSALSKSDFHILKPPLSSKENFILNIKFHLAFGEGERMEKTLKFCILFCSFYGSMLHSANSNVKIY